MNPIAARMANPTTARMVKVGICAALVLALGYVVFVQGARNVDANRGVRAAEGIELTVEQATDMADSTGSVTTLIEDAVIDVSDPSSQTTGATPSVHEADTWYVRRIEDLMSRWGPKYAAAIDDIVKFEHRFKATEDRLYEYFQQQADLTQSTNDPTLRTALQKRDNEEREAYSRWMADAHWILTQAQMMRQDLDDMNVVIEKQQLTVSMLADFSEISAIPSSVKTLHESLSGFRQESDELARSLSSQVFSAELSGR